MQIAARLILLACWLGSGGCTLDFDKFHTRKTDAAPLDASSEAGLGGACNHDSECGDARVYACIRERCALRRVPSHVWQPGAGGLAASSSFELRLGVGAPVPFGGPMR